MLSIGVYLTVVAYKTDQSNSPTWVTDHLKTLKWVGPVAISFGLLGTCLIMMNIVKHNSSSSDLVTSPAIGTKFGFKFF